MAEVIDFCYEYQYPSAVTQDAIAKCLSLATFGGEVRSPHFFSGRFVNPKEAADILLFISALSRTRFFSPGELRQRMIAAADPVVTCDGEQLRFEVFSVCCGVYARFDLHASGLEGSYFSKGTTNVDFNPPMRAALQSITNSDAVGLNVGAEQLELERGATRAVEKKVKLPVRWLKGFVEVQIYQSQLAPLLETTGPELAAVLRSLPEQNLMSAGSISYLTRTEKGLRLSQRDSAGAVAIGAVNRLKVLQPIFRYAKGVHILGGSDGVSSITIALPDGNVHLVLSPDAARGFSGEGQALKELAIKVPPAVLLQVKSALVWSTKIIPSELASELSLDHTLVDAALQVFGTRGLVGFDTSAQAYFHREFPFNSNLVEQLQPRMKKARKILENDGVKILSSSTDLREATVDGDHATHLVQLFPGQDSRCTCHWYMKHGGKRGVCAHVLAAELTFQKLEDDE